MKGIILGALSFNLSLQRILWPISRVFWSHVLNEFGSNAKIMRGTEIIEPGNVSIGENTYIGKSCSIYGYEKVTIGKNSLIARETIILTRNHKFDSIDEPIREQGYTSAPVSIGENVWIGARATILPGITIGKGSIVAAGSVVTKNIPEFTVVAGVPAKEIKLRA